MELKKEKIFMKKNTGNSQLQITLEEDFNVPDSKPDVEKIVTVDGVIDFVEKNIVNGKLLLKGTLQFDVLYISHESEQLVHSIQGKVEFDEMVNMDHITERSDVQVKWELEDLNISLINSRKISVKSLLALTCSAWELYEEEFTVEVEEGKKCQCKYNSMDVTEMKIDKKDLLRLKETFYLPSGKPNIYQVLYQNISLQGMEIRPMDGQILVRGEMHVFVLYSTREDGEKIAYYQGEQPFYSTLPCEGCAENMILQMDYSVQNKELQIQEDQDGEERLLEVDVALNLNFSLYEERQVQYLQDLYSVDQELHLETEHVNYRHLAMKNNTQKRITEQMVLEAPQNPILQICHSMGTIQMDEILWEDQEISVEGSVAIKILYLGEEDAWPVGEVKVNVPFSHKIEGVGTKEHKHFEVTPRLAQLGVVLLGKDTLEIKMAIDMETIVFESIPQEKIVEVSEEDFLQEQLEQMPGMVGYLVQKDEDLWTIAKKFHVTVDSICALNLLEDETVAEGYKLLLARE